MAKSSPPHLDPSEIPAGQDDELNQFLQRLYFRTVNNIDELDKGNINAQWVAFEALGAIVPLLSNGLSHDEVKGAYPISDWREQTVEVPLELLETLISSWRAFALNGKTLGQSFGFEKLNQQGSKPMKQILRKIDEARKLCSTVLEEYIQIGTETPGSLDAALYAAAEKHGVSTSTVERAYREHGKRMLENLTGASRTAASLKTSRSDGVEE